LSFRETVDIIMSLRRIYQLVMGDVIDIVLIQEFLVDNPWGIWDNFIDPSTLTNCFASLGVCHGGCGFVACT
jgi:hypothetical protein